MNRPMPDMIWCGTGSPVVQGFMTGLGLLAVGLAAFPYRTVLTRPPSGQPVHGYSSATAAVRWARIASWLLGGLTVCTIGGYIGIYVAARGRFCDATLTPATRHAVLAWTIILGATAATLVMSAILRGSIRRVQ